MTPDIEKLRKAKNLRPTLQDLEIEFVGDPEWERSDRPVRPTATEGWAAHYVLSGASTRTR